MQPERSRYILLTAIGIAPFYFNGYVNAAIADRPVLYWGFEAICWLVLPAIVLAVLVRSAGLRFADLGFHTKIFGGRSVAWLVLACAFACQMYYKGYLHAYEFARTLLPGESIFDYRSMIPERGLGRIAVVLYFSLSAAFVEEIYFRGLLLKIATFGRNAAATFMAVSPVLFALIHWKSGMANLAATYLLGLGVALAFVLVRNIWPFVAGHAFTDFMRFSAS